ncbi:MAG: tyrosine-type recombinase/integrase [Brasilonema angustatum HA4187-MV1]|jgi:integrase/recombinase XerD|nr:tyrosine-type recombinase/integrase [Brasilonema angustatum HA4187-MV1]
MALSKLDDLAAVLASLPPEKQGEILAQAMVTAAIVKETIKPPKKTGAETTSDLMSNWLEKKSEGTARAYKNDIDSFIHWLQAEKKTNAYKQVDNDLWIWDLNDEQRLNLLDLTKLMVDDCDRYLKYLSKKESDNIITRSTVRRRIAAVKSFLQYAQDSGFTVYNVASATKMPPARKTTEDRILSVSDVGAILSETRKAVKDAQTEFVKKQAIRDWLIIKLLYIGAFRVSEVATLSWEQIKVTESGNGSIKVVGKGDKERVVVIPASQLVHLQTSRESNSPDEPVFKSRESSKGIKAVSDRTIREIVAKYAKLAKLDRIPSPHWFRHSHATHALNGGAPIKVTTKTLGHASASTTLDNYVHTGEEESSSFFLNAD